MPEAPNGVRGSSNAIATRRLGVVFWVPVAWIVLLLLLAVFAELLPIRDPEALGIVTGEVASFEGPGRNAWFGADSQGKDLFANVIHGARPALILGITVTVLAASIGTLFGVLAGYLRGRVDTVTMAATDVALAFPAIVLLLAVRASLGNSIWVFILIFTVLGIAPYTRIVRGATLSLSERGFVKASRAMGASAVRIVGREILPNVRLNVLSFAFIGFAIVIAAEGSLAFIGLSLDQTTWGQLINDGRSSLADHPNLTLIPATVMLITILAFNFVGDAISSLTATREVSTVRRHRVAPQPDSPEQSAGTATNRSSNREPLLRVAGLTTDLVTPAGVVQAVSDISFDVHPGEALAVVGESGCGKTMMIRSVLGTFPLARVDRAGRIELDGVDMLRVDDNTRLRVLGTDIGTIPQNPLTALNPVRRIGKQLIEPMTLHGGLTKAAARARAVDLLEQVGIPDPARRMRSYPHQLSGGMRQRVMIALALSNSPRLLLADEPTTALDVTVQDQIMRLLDDLRSSRDMAVVLVTHDLAVVRGFTDRVAVMYAGQIVESGPTEQVLNSPKHRYTRALIRSIPDLGLESHSRLATVTGSPPSLIDPPSGCRFAARCDAADERCRTEQPPLDSLSAGHDFACFHPVGTPVALGSTALSSTATSSTSTSPRSGSSEGPHGR
jgi:peptide/nickel transport system permease protein